jgi:hypothetical protein
MDNVSKKTKNARNTPRAGSHGMLNSVVGSIKKSQEEGSMLSMMNMMMQQQAQAAQQAQQAQQQMMMMFMMNQQRGPPQPFPAPSMPGAFDYYSGPSPAHHYTPGTYYDYGPQSWTASRYRTPGSASSSSSSSSLSSSSSSSSSSSYYEMGAGEDAMGTPYANGEDPKADDDDRV